MSGWFSGSVAPPQRRMRGTPRAMYGGTPGDVGGMDDGGDEMQQWLADRNAAMAAGGPSSGAMSAFVPRAQVPTAQHQAMQNLINGLHANNQSLPQPGTYGPAPISPRMQAMRQLADRNASAFAQGGQSPRNIPIANPNRGMQANGQYGGASQVSNPVYGNAGLGTVGVQQPSQYLAPGRRNPYYGNYISGGRVQTGQMQNWVAGRWPGLPQAQQDEPFDVQAAKDRAAMGAMNRAHGVGRPLAGTTFNANDQMRDYIARAKEYRAQKVADANGFRQNRMAEIAKSQQSQGFDPMGFLQNAWMHPAMPGAAENNAAAMRMAGMLAGINAQGAQHRDVIGLRQQELDAQRTKMERDHELAKGKMQADLDRMQKDHELRKSQIELELQKLEQQRKIAAAQLGVEHPDADLSGINGPGNGSAATPGANGYTPPLRMFDHNQLPDFLDATHGMSDQDLQRHMQNKGVTSGHLDRYIEANKDTPIFEWAQDKRDRLRRLEHAQRLRGLFGNAPPAAARPAPAATEPSDYEGSAYTF